MILITPQTHKENNVLKAVFLDVGSHPLSKGNVMLKSFKRFLSIAAAFLEAL